MEMKVNPETTSIQIVPSEEVGYTCALIIKNDYVDATLRLTATDVQGLIRLLNEYGK